MKKLNLWDTLLTGKPAQNFASVQVKEKPVTVAEIHETFYTEVDRLLESAKIKHDTSTDKTDVLEKGKRLQSLGFVRTQEVSESSAEELRIRDLERANKQKQDLIDAINYFTQKYPHYKFITKQSVEKICEKYGLIYGEVFNYIGTVPESNLEEIEKFKIADEDKAYVQELPRLGSWSGSGFIDIRGNYTPITNPNEIVGYSYFQERQDLEKRFNETLDKGDHRQAESIDRMIRTEGSITPAPLEIAAPVKDFDTRGMVIENSQLKRQPAVFLDPVVLQPVYYKGTQHYLIVTAWGDEATDPLVHNPRHN